MPLHPTPRPQGAGLLVGKQIGRAITAARRQASRQGQCPCTPDCPPWRAGLMWKMFRVCPHGRRSATGLAARGRGSAPAPHSAPTGRGAARGQARWPRDYRRSAEGLAARRSGVPFEIVDRHSAVPSRCPSPCTASYKHGRYGMPFRPTQRKSQRDSNITLAFLRSFQPRRPPKKG